jgi:FkbM family methyltransferase
MEGQRVSVTGTGPGNQSRGGGNEPEIVSYAQNAEDVRLWRVFGGESNGFYVDVGAGDPVRDSVTKLFYDAGWNGINIEPGPLHAELVEARPRDVNLKLAVATQGGEADFWVSAPDSGLSGFERPPDELVPEGFSFTRTRVDCARLDALISEHASGRAIDFLKVDVEGAERDVLSSFDPHAIRPTVILVEAISPLESRPSHEEWESLLVDKGYVFAAFDGINRFYVPAERPDLVEILAYPTSLLDRYESFHLVSERLRTTQQLEQNAHLEQAMGVLAHERDALRSDLATLQAERTSLSEDVRRLESENAGLATARDRAASELSAIRATVSWRITRPLRAVREAQLRRRPTPTRAGAHERLISGRAVARRSPGVTDADPIFEVTGVPAAEILDRCAELRATGTSAAQTTAEPTWSLSDFTGVSDTEFVRAAHVILLGRLPGQAAATRRAAELEAGRSRFEILVRLALSPEGRRRHHQRVSGPAMRSLVATGRGIERAARIPLLTTLVGRLERLVRDESSGGH